MQKAAKQAANVAESSFQAIAASAEKATAALKGPSRGLIDRRSGAAEQRQPVNGKSGPKGTFREAPGQMGIVGLSGDVS